MKVFHAKMNRLVWLNGLANQLVLYVRTAGGLVNDAERAYARDPLEMIQAVDTEESKTLNGVWNDAVKELAKRLFCGRY